jgi:toxin-antitoxin system PIN domain toxin
MIIVDANVLLYAVNENSAHHAAMRSWWEDRIAGEQSIGLSWTVLLAFLRISTSPSAFAEPLHPEQALSIVQTWLSHPNVRTVAEASHHWSVLHRLLAETGMAGNLTTDAHLASLAITHGAVLASCDSDFARFRALRWENPLDN